MTRVPPCIGLEEQMIELKNQFFSKALNSKINMKITTITPVHQRKLTRLLKITSSTIYVNFSRRYQL